MSATLHEKIKERSATVSVVGCGYVGLPLSLVVWRAGFSVFAVDIDPKKVEMLRAGRTYVSGVEESELSEAVTSGRFNPTGYSREAASSDVVLLTLPTPLTADNRPDLSAIIKTAEWLREHLRREQLIVLESTTYPGTTEEVLKPLLEESGLKAGEDFYLAYSPHRYDPGVGGRGIGEVPRVVGGVNEASLDVAAAFYETFTVRIVRVSSLKVAEATKMLENTFRAVNIALVNELKEVFIRLGVDTYEVIEAAATKPYGFMKFSPGPGFGGHCVPVDPLYLAWRAKQAGLECAFVELAGRINRQTPRKIVERVLKKAEEMGVDIRETPFLVVGVAYKPNIADTRESPAFPIMRLLRTAGVRTLYHDPLIPKLPQLRHYPELAGMASSPLENLNEKVVLLVTDHDTLDYGALKEAMAVFDTRFGLRKRGIVAPNIFEV